MKLPCDVCGESTKRKRLAVLEGVYLKRPARPDGKRSSRACPQCLSMSDAEHRVEYEKEVGDDDTRRV